MVEGRGVVCSRLLYNGYPLAEWSSYNLPFLMSLHSLLFFTILYYLSSPPSPSFLSSKLYNGKIFGRPVMKKDGSAGTRVVMPPIEELQRGYPGTDTRDQWIQYAVKDAEVTVADENFVLDCIISFYTRVRLQ